MNYNFLVLVSLIWLVLPAGKTATLYGGVSNEIGRIGIEYCSGNQRITKVFKGGPAYQAGLLKDDKVLTVDGRTHFQHHWGYGEVGSVVNLTLRRHSDVLSFNITRTPSQAGW